MRTAIATVDHFHCYEVRTTRPFVTITGVTLVDQFGPMTVDVKGAEDHAAQLLCYRIEQTSLPKFLTVSSTYVANQFGTGTLDVKTPFELCVPALVSP